MVQDPVGTIAVADLKAMKAVAHFAARTLPLGAGHSTEPGPPRARGVCSCDILNKWPIFVSSAMMRVPFIVVS